ncbi:hypothetical protein L1987_28670 [Smallanthus sonchifolius]|uniref:Uncharacterized protein n=1 Tax=Smallanthus sonchifolius TaxID=185202 RepID=A0ACB9HXR5_9ASTR|nr:hypothetical protein L1987_28670 [Smallanthus sonchifolius]
MADNPEEPPQNSEQVCNFFRKPSKNKNLRKRAHAGEEDDDDKSSVRSTSEQHPDVDTKATIFHFDSSKEIQVQNDSRATATLETDTDFSNDARAIRERVLKQAGKGNAGNNEKLYKGIHGYTDYKAGFRREQTVASEKAGGSHGPLRASAHIRVSARFDYQPDICKDYKETGYCGYGDSCKFMHDRGDYKSGGRWRESGMKLRRQERGNWH